MAEVVPMGRSTRVKALLSVFVLTPWTHREIPSFDPSECDGSGVASVK